MKIVNQADFSNNVLCDSVNSSQHYDRLMIISKMDALTCTLSVWVSWRNLPKDILTANVDLEVLKVDFLLITLLPPMTGPKLATSAFKCLPTVLQLVICS